MGPSLRLRRHGQDLEMARPQGTRRSQGSRRHRLQRANRPHDRPRRRKRLPHHRRRHTWDGPHPTGAKRAVLSVVKGEFWLVIQPTKNKADFPRASADGLTWRNLPKTIPAGKIAISDKGTLINTDGRRFNILRSADNGETWQEVYTYKPDADHVQPASQGLRDVAFGYTNAE